MVRCQICKDTGINSGKICDCLLKELNRKISLSSSSQSTFKSFEMADENLMDELKLVREENKQLKTFTLYQSSAVNVQTDEHDKVSVGNVILNVKYNGSTTQETYNLAHIDNVRELGNAHNKLVDRVVALETDMPTKMSDLTNDTEYVTKAEMEAAIAEAIKNLVTAEQLEAAITNNITDTLNTEV